MADPAPALTWSSALELGIAELDADHRKLADLVNRIAAATESESPDFDVSVNEFHTVLQAHAAREKQRLHATPPHDEEYDAALAAAEAFLARAKVSTGEHRIPRTLTRDYLRHWLLDHILVSDLAARDRLVAAGRIAADLEPTPTLSRLKIGQRVWMVAIAPLVLLTLAAGAIVYDRFSDAADLDRVTVLAQTSAVIGDAVHALQKERGASAGFINSKGKEFAADLRTFRNQSDAALATFASAATDASALGLVSRTADARQALSGLAALRGKVDGFSVSVPDQVAAHTEMVRAMLAMVDGVADLSPNEELARNTTAFAIFLYGKDLAGIERARGSAGFGAGKFSPALFRDFATIGGQQTANFRIAQRLLSKEMATVVAAALQTPAEQRVAQMREIVTRAQETGNLEGVTGSDWFATSTARIEVLKEAEDRVIALIAGSAAVHARAARTQAILVSIGIAALLIAAGVLALVITASITRPMERLRCAIDSLRHGDTTTPIAGQTRSDEIGLIARAVQAFRQNIIHTAHGDAVSAVDATVAAQRAAIRQGITERFRHDIETFLGTLSGAAGDLREAAAGMASTSGEGHRQATQVADAAVEASRSVDAVAAASEELAASIAEIARQVTRSAVISRNVADSSDSAQQAMTVLSDSATKIGDIIGIITDIASRTNLLALNATIEAARAGEAGKGFAVVAGEVKALSSQTERATNDIANQVSAVQGATRQVVEAIEIVTQNIVEMSEISGMIAGAIEEQRAATEEISHSVLNAAEGTRDVTANISGVADANDRIGGMSQTVSGAAENMAERTRALRRQVESFLRDFAAA